MARKSNPTVKAHPLAESLAKLLFGIEVCPRSEQRKMVQRAIKEAVKWYSINEPLCENCQHRHSGVQPGCNMVYGSRGWRQLGVYDG